MRRQTEWQIVVEPGLGRHTPERGLRHVFTESELGTLACCFKSNTFLERSGICYIFLQVKANSHVGGR